MDPVLERLRRELSGRYEVEQELGRGGMAVVYMAMDLRHDRRVAIKVLRSDLGLSGSERFLREIRTVAQLHHPHILGLHDSGSIDGHLFYVMPYVEGETLREKLEREGPFSVEEAVRIGREVADALDYSHGRGIVHRDIKPENIFLSAGHALVADFGIARAVDAAKAAIGDTTLTDAGLAVGTPAYMSPEQATADPRIDGRSDQYALGCVLYEMLAGQPPFVGPTSQAVMARHTADPVPPLRTVRAVPPELEASIVRALAKVPADRWQSARVFADAMGTTSISATLSASASNRSSRLTQLGLSAAVFGVVALILWLTLVRGATESMADDAPLVAVLAFDVGSDSTQLPLADGIATQIFNSLVRAVSVVSRGREDAYRDRSADIQTVGRELGVTSVVSGALRIAGNKLRVNAQLTDVRTGRVLWVDEFHGETSVNGQPLDLFSIQDSISVKIVGALLPQVSAETRSKIAGGVRTRDSLALAYYLEGRRLLTRITPLTLDSTISLFQQAIDRDSTYADAWAGWADALSYQPWWGYAKSGSESLVTSSVDYGIAVRHAIEKALRFEPGNIYALRMRAEFRMLYDWDWDGSRRDYQELARIAPGDEEARYSMGAVYHYLEPESALVLRRQRIAENPKYRQDGLRGANSFAMARQHDSALWAAEEARRAGVSNAFSNWNLMNGYLTAGNRAAADSAAQRMEQLGADVPGALALVAHYYARAGNIAGARRMLKRVLALSQQGYVPPSTIGIARLATGDREGALADLETSARNHDFSLIQDIIFGYEAVRGTQRFQDVARRIFKQYPVPRTPWP